MKMQPIVYRQEYGEGSISSGFTPCYNEKNQWIINRWVDAQPSNWQSGSAIIFSIHEKYNHEQLGIQTRQIAYRCIYDKDIPVDKQLLLHALHDNELRGIYAERIVHSLYVEFFVLMPEENSPMKKFLPEVVEFYEELRRKYP
jgi:hypothetical protein